VLVLAAGVQRAFEVGDYTLPTIGYAIMRFAMVVQWLRVAASDPESRPIAVRYAVGISIVQVLWIVRLFVTQGFPDWLLVVVFAFLAVCEMAVPLIAERRTLSRWHPHHIAERYGLFVIILLGESVLASTVAVQQVVNAGSATGLFVLLAASGLALLFGLWWIYFLEPAHEGLERRRSRSFYWGYGHYGIFVALTAAGAGLEAAVASMAESAEEGHHVDATVVAYGVAVPVAVFLALMWVLYRPLTGPTVIPPAVSLGAAVVVLLIPLAAHSTGIAVAVLLIALTVAVAVAATIVYRRIRPPVTLD
jgi:low temperature requirement protein LtrA